MAETKPTNEEIVKMLERVLEELDQLRAGIDKLAKTA